MTGHLIMAGVILAVTVAVFLLGWHAHGLYTDERAILPKRHSHRKGAPQEKSGPRPTALLQPPRPEPPPWHFAGESEQGWAAESAEYELLTQTAELEVVPGVDTPSDYMQSMTERVNAMIAAWAEQGNYDRHTMHEVG